MYRLMDPSNLAAFAAAMKMKAERPGSMASEGSPMNRYKYEYDVTILCWNNEHDSPEEEHNYIRLDNCFISVPLLFRNVPSPVDDPEEHQGGVSDRVEELQASTGGFRDDADAQEVSNLKVRRNQHLRLVFDVLLVLLHLSGLKNEAFGSIFVRVRMTYAV
ncbi:hypothetical protein quinque_014912 [Culex quinquefasciatus]